MTPPSKRTPHLILPVRPFPKPRDGHYRYPKGAEDPKAAWKAWKFNVRLLARPQWGRGLIKGDIKIRVELYYMDWKIGDIDNIEGGIYDALETVCYKDDKRICDDRGLRYALSGKNEIRVWVAGMSGSAENMRFD